MMTWSHRNVVLNFFRSFLSLDVLNHLELMPKKTFFDPIHGEERQIVESRHRHPLPDCDFSLN